MSNDQSRNVPFDGLVLLGGAVTPHATEAKIIESLDLALVSGSGNDDGARSTQIDSAQIDSSVRDFLNSDATTGAKVPADLQDAIGTVAVDNAAAHSSHVAVHDPAIEGSSSLFADNFAPASIIAQDITQSGFSASLASGAEHIGISTPDVSAVESLLGPDNLLSSHLATPEHTHNAQSHGVGNPVHADGSGSGTVGDPDGQLWAADDGDTSGNPDGHGSDARLEHMDSDGLSNDWVDEYSITSTGAFTSVGLDTAANLYFALDNNTSTGENFYVGHISTGADQSITQFDSIADEDIMNSFVVDPANDTIYMDLFGGDYNDPNPSPYTGKHGGDIIKVTYNPITGAISSPYNPTASNPDNGFAGTGTINNNGVLLDTGTSGGVYADGRSFALSNDGSTLYYVDDNNGDPGDFWGFKTNGIYEVSTSGSVGAGTAPTPIEITTPSQFPTTTSGGDYSIYITGLVFDQAKDLIYFTTDGASEGINTSSDGLWYISPTAGSTAHQMTLPGGVSLDFPAFYGNNIALDPDAQNLYVTDVQRDAVIQLTLNAAGTAFTSGNNDFYTTDTNTSDGASTYALTWASLATEGSLTGTSALTTQGSGSTTTLLTATPTITDPQGSYIGNLSGYTIEVIGGTRGNGTGFGVTSGALTGAAGLSGDDLAISGVQNGSLDGGQVAVSWNSTTDTLTLLGDVSDAEYKSLLAGVTFQETSNTDNTVGSHPTRVIDFIANEGVSVLHPTTTDPNEQTITITLNRAPILGADSYVTQESGTSTGTAGTGGTGVLGNDSDPDGDTITVTAVNGAGGNVGTSTAGAYGHLTLFSDGHYTYTADNTSAINSAAPGSHPVDNFTYSVSDGDGGVTTQTVSFTINRAPITNNDDITVFAGATDTTSTYATGVLNLDSDPDGDSLTVSAISGGTVGTSLAGTYGHLTLNANGTYTYAADNSTAINAQPDNAVLTDTFTYTTSDGNGGTTTAELVITVDQAPTVTSLTASATSTANFAAAHTVTYTLDVGKNVVGSSAVLSLSDGGTASYASGSGTQTLTFTQSATDAPGSITVTGLHSGSLADAANNPLAIAGTAVSTYTDAVTDSAADVSTYFNSLDSAVSHISTITLNNGGTPALDLTASQVVNDQTLIGKIVSSYELVVNDTASDVAGDFDSLENYAATIGAVVFTDGGAPTLSLTATQVSNDATLLAKVQGPYDLYVSNVTGTLYDSYQKDFNASDVKTETIEFNNDGSETLFGYVSGLSLTGTSNNDIFVMQNAADVTATGLGGNDKFEMYAKFSAADVIDGGGGKNEITLDGNYSGADAVVMNETTISNIQTIVLAAGFSYNLTTNDANVAASQTLEIDGAPLTAGSTLTFDGSAESDGTFNIYTGNGTAVITGGAGNDVVHGGTGIDTIHGGGGNDKIVFTTGFTGSDTIDGGTGSNELVLDGNYTGGNAIVLGASSLTNIQLIDLSAGQSYSLTTNDGNVAASQSLEIDGANLGAGDSLTFNGSAETDGTFNIYAGNGTANITGGAGSDAIHLGNGTDFVTGGGGGDKIIAGTGADTFNYTAVSDSTSTNFDVITGFNTATGMFDLQGALTNITGVDTAVTTGKLSVTGFDAHLAADIGAAQLAAHHAVLFTPSTGGLAGDTFLIIDENGVAGYQAGQDLVIELVGASNLGSLSTSNFESV